MHRDLACPLDLAEQFDLVVSYHVLEHIQADQAALENLYAVVAPGGYLMILVPGGLDTLPDDTPEKLRVLGHVRAGYTVAEIRDKVIRAGFQILSAKTAVGLIGTWARRVYYALCLTSKSFVLKGIGWAISSVLAFLEYWFPIRLTWDVLLIAKKDQNA
jgi:SAM-dependent methyltransferase